MNKQEFESVWDAIEDDPVKCEIYKLRSESIHVINEYIKAKASRGRQDLSGDHKPTAFAKPSC